jgi:hypothetical protein
MVKNDKRGGEAVEADWHDLALELDAWSVDGQRATLWWRDDDAAAMTPALARLFDMADGAPVSLAVVPRNVEAGLARAAERRGVAFLQHGWSHANHAAAGEKKTELVAGRPAAIVLAELETGRRRLAELFGRRFLAVLVPPWNRIAASLVPCLAGIGFRGLSADRPRAAARPADGLVQVNVHADLTDWTTRRFVGHRRALGRLVEHLGARRAGRVDGAEPTGILTHHLVADADTEAFLARLLAETRAHCGARWLAAEEVFACA